MAKQTQQPEYEERVEHQRTTQREQNAQQVATQKLLDETSKVENPQFLESISEVAFATNKYDWVTDELAGLFARANFLANRSETYEREAKWLNRNRAERKIIMHNPGRLTKAVTLDVPGTPRYPVLELAQRVHGRSDKDRRDEFHTDDRAAIRQGAEVATNHMSNAVEGAGRKAVSEATAVTRSERESESSMERAAKGVWGR